MNEQISKKIRKEVQEYLATPGNGLQKKLGMIEQSLRDQKEDIRDIKKDTNQTRIDMNQMKVDLAAFKGKVWGVTVMLALFWGTVSSLVINYLLNH